MSNSLRLTAKELTGAPWKALTPTQLSAFPSLGGD